MSIIDKVIAAVTPLESEAERVDARDKARAAAEPGGWLEHVLRHHVQIERGFELVKASSNAGARRAAQKQLAILLTGHSLAEEAVLYPALALNGEKTSAEASYFEQSAAKVQLAALDDLDPMSQDYVDKLEHIRGAVAHHVYEEEGSRFPTLLEKTDTAKNATLTARYREECARYFDAPDDAMSAQDNGLGEMSEQPGFGPTRNDKTMERMDQERSSPGATSAGGFNADAPDNDTSKDPSSSPSRTTLDSSAHTADRRGDAAGAPPPLTDLPTSR